MENTEKRNENDTTKKEKHLFVVGDVSSDELRRLAVALGASEENCSIVSDRTKLPELRNACRIIGMVPITYYAGRDNA